MKKFYKIIVMLLFGATILYAGDGLSQPHLVSTIPSLNDDNVPPNTTLSFTFDSTIVENSIKPHTITLKQKEPSKHKIKGNISVVNKNTLVFSPQQQLEKGVYDIKIKSLKLKDPDTNEIKPKTKWQKFIAWLCGLVYDDINDCPLCQYVCDLQKHTKTKAIKYMFEVKDDAPKVTSIIASQTLIELSEHNSTQLSITATYDNNNSEDITQKATYTSSDSSVADVDKGLVSTFKEGSTTLEVSYGGKNITITVEVYEMIEGHLLPHKPQDPDATLLGVDKNNNGVRDEVERWIYKDMPTYHHPEIERVIAMQQAKAYQLNLSDVNNTNDIPIDAVNRGIDCWAYYIRSKQIPFNESYISMDKYLAKLQDKVFNTKERLKTYFQFNKNLGIRVFTDTQETVNNCDTDIDLLP
ncbi:Ig-like domain-containing protein [Sulfurovum sp. CS9]|uniref:Ig-like domain-containing protein n=1 Tax=Sulfurovum sp. CS9 TaxID=3391146 RepID=UPI0039E76683